MPHLGGGCSSKIESEPSPKLFVLSLKSRGEVQQLPGRQQPMLTCICISLSPAAAVAVVLCGVLAFLSERLCVCVFVPRNNRVGSGSGSGGVDG